VRLDIIILIIIIGLVLTKLFVNGKSIKLNPNKNFEEIYKVLYFSVGLGYYRIPIVAYDKYGNKSTSYIKGESVRTD